ncbi:hypothetical protein I312_103987 [Cryptococcus bacillisporus CA1280]|uniref:uncharacterized protein n=1 Tax=Cryptococcus bacillisporus CA1280 TaxID=1296109 RepID=UPI0033669559
MPSKLHILSPRGCAYHSGDTSGKTYDSTGKVCPALTSEDRTLLAIVLSLCAFVLVVLAGIYVRQYIKGRITAKGSMLSTQHPPISVMIANQTRLHLALLHRTLIIAKALRPFTFPFYQPMVISFQHPRPLPANQSKSIFRPATAHSLLPLRRNLICILFL